MSDTARLRSLLADAGYRFVELPIVYPARVFVELAGEELRRQLYLTSAEGGEELALRPDFTIPVSLHHLATGAAKRKANYAYVGPVFRVRPGESGEFIQAGVESLGRVDRVAADADMLKLALSVAKLYGLKRPQVRIGDSALFAALLDTLDLSAPWRQRLARAFGDTKRLKAFLTNGHAKSGPQRSELEDADVAAVKAAVAERFATTGLGEAGGRSVDEIAERFVAKAALAHGIPKRTAATLGAFLKVAGTPAKSLAALRALADREKLKLGAALDTFAKRIDAFAAHGIDVDGLAFAADFGRRLDYYTGFVFEVPGRGKGGPAIGGGRYDSMTAHIGDATAAVPAVGFSVWLDRIGKEARR
ncbi:MAG TPA: ATP phosphoribosyltransferase regulatory subunit [Bauldia sp.]|nr:ATP phosphoribosyltransferase regulatory subunit [Bauldia sp.]